MTENDLRLVRRVLADLESLFDVLLVGGWAEELHEMTQPRAHGDVDVLLLDPSFDALDSYVADRHEVIEKHLSQKRAYLEGGVLIELFIARWNEARYETLWWDRVRWPWPANMGPVAVDGLRVASKDLLRSFRDCYPVAVAARPS